MSHRSARTVAAEGVGRLGGAHMAVGRPRMILLQAPDVDNAYAPLVDRTVQMLRAAGGLPVPPCQVDGERQRVHLVFALP